MEKVILFIAFLSSALVLFAEHLSPDVIEMIIEYCYVAIKVMSMLWLLLALLIIYADKRKSSTKLALNKDKC